MFRRLFHNRLIIRNFTYTFDIISSMPVAKFFKIWSTVAGYDEYYGRGLSKSEMKKYFE